MSKLYEPWKRSGRGQGPRDDARHEVDDLLHARNPHFGIMPQGIGHRMRRRARESLYEGPPPRASLLGLPTGLALVLIAFGALLAIAWIVWVIYFGPVGGTLMLLSVAGGAAAGLLLMAAILLVFMALVLVVTAPWRIVSLVRRVASRN